MPSYSKAPRGLFVLSWETCIFTGTSISPGPLLRQRPSRYSIRAGRNLPDKEFRYLRTVIVTAAVYRGFTSGLRAPLRLTFRHWAGVSPHTSSYKFAQTCVFVKQSLGPMPCGLLAHPVVSRPVTLPRHPFFRSYGAILPSSLTGGHPSTLGSSPSPPVSVCGTVGDHPHAAAFLDGLGVPALQPALTGLGSPLRVQTTPASPERDARASVCCGSGLSWPHHLRATTRHVQWARCRYPAVSPPRGGHLRDRDPTGAGMCTCCPSPTPLGLGLGPTNPELINRAQEPLGFRCGRFSRPFAATHTGIRTSHRSTGAPAPASPQMRTLPYQHVGSSPPTVPRLRRRA